MILKLTEEEIKKAIALYVLRTSKQVVELKNISLVSLDYGEEFECVILLKEEEDAT